MKGYLTEGAELIGILCVNGIIAVSLRDCELILRSIAEAEPWLHDPGCAYLPWDPSPLPSRPLTIGVIREDHECHVLPPIRRTLDVTCSKLEAAGHELVDMELYICDELAKNATDFFQLEGAAVTLHGPLSNCRADMYLGS